MNIRQGDSGELVRNIQQQLINDGYHDIQNELGLFGHSTETAVRDFQMKNRLTVDGIVGPQTWVALVGIREPDSSVLNLHGNNSHCETVKREAANWFVIGVVAAVAIGGYFLLIKG